PAANGHDCRAERAHPAKSLRCGNTAATGHGTPNADEQSGCRDHRPRDTGHRTPMSNPGVVIIGRNEGERLRRCLDSVVGLDRPVVYVDSGSTDGSVALARAKGAEVVELDLTRPFTAGRARNAGWAQLERIAPEVPLVQFVDGDCEVVADWLERASATMGDAPASA